METSTDRRRHRRQKLDKASDLKSDQEASSVQWEFISLTKEEEDMVYRMFNLVGERWDLIAGRIPGRAAEEIERFWLMRHHDMFAERRRNQT